MKINIILLLTMSFFTSTINVKAQRLICDSIQEFYIDGDRWLYNERDNQSISVTLKTDRQYGKYYFLYIQLDNQRWNHFEFNPDNIFAISKNIPDKIDYTNDEQIIKSISYKDYSKKIKRQQNWSLALLGLAEGMNTSGAGYSYSTTYTPYGTFYTSTYNANQARQASVESANRINMYSTLLQNEKELIKIEYLKKNTIFTGSRISGYVLFNHIKTEELSVYIPLDDKIFRFTFDADFFADKKKRRQK